MERDNDLFHFFIRRFIKYCAAKFGWSDLSNDVIMDIGCGKSVFCGKSVLEKFRNVRKIIGIDRDPKVVLNFKSNYANIECALANIEERETLEIYEGKMSKVISTYTFNELLNKEESLQNVYHLLQPGGEAAILFVVKSSLYEWLMELIRHPKWKEMYKSYCAENWYPSEHGIVYYKEMADKIGFGVLDVFEEEKVIPHQNDQICKDRLHKIHGHRFEIPSESLEEFKEDSFQTFLKVGGRDEQGRPCYRSTYLSLLLVKPKKDSDSETTDSDP